jgi:hypothetical protein
MKPDELKRKFPQASGSFISANSDNAGPVQQLPAKRERKVRDRDTGTDAKLERHLGDGTLGAAQVQKGTGQRILVRVTSFRTRLLDEDNQCEKYHVDLLRYAGVIPTDAPGQTKIEVCQQKVGKGEREFVRIEVF